MEASSTPSPVIHTRDGRRTFACFPAAILAFIVDDDSRFLLLAHPERTGWQTISGAVEADEAPLEALVREVEEEAGAGLRIRPLGVAHTFSYPYAPEVPTMLSMAYVAQYLGGDITPGSDMAGSSVGWFGLDEINHPDFSLSVPEQPWLFGRAAIYAAALRAGEDVQLEPWRERRGAT